MLNKHEDKKKYVISVLLNAALANLWDDTIMIGKHQAEPNFSYCHKAFIDKAHCHGHMHKLSYGQSTK